jgi:hypothetical protein
MLRAKPWPPHAGRAAEFAIAKVADMWPRAARAARARARDVGGEEVRIGR